MTKVIATERLELILLERRCLEGYPAREPAFDGFEDPHGFLRGAEDVVRLRLEQLEANAAVAPWLLRAVVLRRVAIGFIGFHAAPDESGVVEIGYELLPAFRRAGYASEALGGLITWAAGHGARIVRACVHPDNAASLALLARHGFALVGEQIDEEDGRELVFERATTG